MKLGVALSGGFVKSLAHAGLLKAIDEAGLTVHAISGASSGSIVAALYAAGIKPDEMLEISKSLSWRKVAKPSLKGGIFSLEGLYDILMELLGELNVEELKIPFAATVVDIKTLKPKFLKEGRVADCVVASCSIPPLFSPWRVGSSYYVDGGIRNCLPSEFPLAMGCDVTLCSNVNVAPEDFDPKSLKDVSMRVGIAQLLENIEKREAYCDKLVNHSLRGSAYSFELSEEFFEVGYRNGLKSVEEIKGAL